MSYRQGVGVVTLLLVAAARVACAGSDRAAAAQREAAVEAAEAARLVAMVEVDVERLDALLDKSLTYTHSNGVVDSKQSLIDGLVAAGVDYQQIDPVSTHVRVRGDGAVVTSRVAMVVAAAGAVRRLSLQTTATWWYGDGRWQLVAYQSTGVSP